MTWRRDFLKVKAKSTSTIVMGKIADAIRDSGLPQQKRTQMLYLDSEFEKLEAERDALKLENLNLKAQVNPLQEKVKRLEERLKEEAAKKKSNVVDVKQALPQQLHEVVRMLTNFDRSWCTAESIASGYQKLTDERMSETKAEVLLERLVKMGLAEHVWPEWCLTTLGKEYAVHHELDTR